MKKFKGETNVKLDSVVLIIAFFNCIGTYVGPENKIAYGSVAIATIAYAGFRKVIIKTRYRKEFLGSIQ